MTGRALRRSILILSHDTAMAAASFLLSLYLRLGDEIYWWPRQVVELGLLVFTLAALAVFLVLRLDTGVWRYASIGDLGRIVRAVAIVIAVFLAVQFAITRLDDLPRSFLMVEFVVLTGLLAGPRFAYRIWKDGTLASVFERGGDRVPVLLVGAGDGSELFIREMTRGPDAAYRVVGIVDDRGTRTGRRIRGVAVLGGLDDLEAAVDRLTGSGLRPQRLVLTRAQMDGATVRRVFETGDRLGIPVSRMPRIGALEAADGAALRLRPVNVEDVLGRPQATLDRESMARLISGRRVLVTGAGGTIGSELARQIAGFAPAALTLADNSEHALYQIDLDLSERAPQLARDAVILDVRDRTGVAAVMARARPDLVFHAAALKHVPLMEANIDDAVLTNAVGSRVVADAARAAGAAAMVLISTDKAVNPTNVMGATKRLAEAYGQALDLAGRGPGPRPGVGSGSATRFLTTRFGNVLGSTGSVVPLFQRQLERGGPLTVTHPEITRYFMTVREAVELVLQAAALETRADAAGGQARGAITVLDMGEPVRIVDLARQMIRLAGLEPDKDIRIAFTGLRPGEKLTEELFHDAETLERTAIPAIRRARPRTADLALLARGLDELEAAARARDTDRTRSVLARLVPEYRPAAAGEAVGIPAS